LRIVPFTVEQFSNLFYTFFKNEERLSPSILLDILIRCRADSNASAPEWKRKISKNIERMLESCS